MNGVSLRAQAEMKRDEPPTAEQNRHDQGMGESDFDSIHETVACSLQNCEVIMIGGVRNNIVNNAGHCGRGARESRGAEAGGCEPKEARWWWKMRKVERKRTVSWKQLGVIDSARAKLRVSITCH